MILAVAVVGIQVNVKEALLLMCGAACGDGEVDVMPPAAVVTVAVLGSCCCDCNVAVIMNVVLL